MRWRKPLGVTSADERVRRDVIMTDDDRENLAPPDQAPDHAVTDDLSLAVGSHSPNIADIPAADDSLVAVVACDADIPLAQIDATLDLLASTPDIADLPPLDWDLPG